MQSLLTKPWWVKALILSGIGIVLAIVAIYTSASYEKAKYFLLSDPTLNQNFGSINASVLISASLKKNSSDKKFITKGDFTFYVIGDNKNGIVKIHTVYENGRFNVYKK
jgi:hypothetical protein